MKSKANRQTSQHRTIFKIGVVLVILLVGQLFLGCAAQKVQLQNERDAGHLDGYSHAVAYMLQDHFARLYLPHITALSAAEEKILKGTDIRESVAGLQQVPGIKAVIVASGTPNASFTIPPEISFSEANYQELVSDSFVQRKEIAPRKQLLPFHNRLLGGIMRDRWHRFPSPSGTETVLVRTLHRDSPDISQRITIGFVLDIQWLLNLVPVQMDSLMKDNLLLTFMQTHPSGGIGELDIVIYQVNSTTEDIRFTNSNRVIWSTKQYNKDEVNRQTTLWPFFFELPIAVKARWRE